LLGQKRAALLSERRRDPAVLVEPPQTPTPDELALAGAADDGEAVTPTAGRAAGAGAV